MKLLTQQRKVSFLITATYEEYLDEGGVCNEIKYCDISDSTGSIDQLKSKLKRRLTKSMKLTVSDYFTIQFQERLLTIVFKPYHQPM
jgi:hypothetical protein